MRKNSLQLSVCLLAAAFALVALRLLWVNVWRGADFQAMAQAQRLSATPVCQFARGDFLDRNGEALTNRSERVLLCFPAQLANRDASHITQLLTDLGITPCGDITAKLAADQPFVLSRSLSAEQASRATTQLADEPGLFATTYRPRYAPHSTATHTIGYVDSSGHGKSGLELQYDAVLQNRACPELAITCDEQGRQTGRELRLIESSSGGTAQNVRLTLDFSCQQLLDSAMAGKSGAAVLLDCQTGDVLALTSAPNYDPDCGQPPTTGDSYLNKAFAYYPPASVFKLVLAAAALETGQTIDEGAEFNCTGEVTISSGQTIHCWQTTGHGTEDISAALANSCNPYFITLGQQLGGEVIREYAWRLGLTEQVLRGFAVNSTNMLDFNSNVPADVANVSIGEKGIRTTPLMLARLLATIANDGLMPEPRLVIDIEDENGRPTETIPAATPRRVISSSTARSLRQMLQNAVANGTGAPAASSLISIGGKTGTSQNFGVWFACFFPADNPRWAMAVYIQDGSSGGKSAGTVCREVAEKLAQLQNITHTNSV